ncbi:MAG: GNAT family N-acetyltransferase [Lacibacter sp.]
MNEIIIRIANPDDAELIAEMSRITFYDAFAKDNSKEDMDFFLNEQFTKAALKKEVEEANGIFMLAYVNNDAAGYARMRLKNSENILAEESAIEIARIYAMPSAIGKGVGSALMQKCIDVAAEQNKTVIWLGVWEKNERAIAFYTRWGFNKFSEHSFLLGSDLQTDWLMKRTVVLP